MPTDKFCVLYEPNFFVVWLYIKIGVASSDGVVVGADRNITESDVVYGIVHFRWAFYDERKTFALLLVKILRSFQQFSKYKP